MHWVIASELPLIVTARSVELGSISEATCIDAPVTSRISFIFDPPLPIREPHCDAGTISRKVIGGLGTVAGDTKLAKSCQKIKEHTYILYGKFLDSIFDVVNTHI